MRAAALLIICLASAAHSAQNAFQQLTAHTAAQQVRNSAAPTPALLNPISIGDRVITMEDEIGTVEGLNAAGLAMVRLDPGSAIITTPASKLSRSVKCLADLCGGQRIIFMNELTGVADLLFENGMARILLYSNNTFMPVPAYMLSKSIPALDGFKVEDRVLYLEKYPGTIKFLYTSGQAEVLLDGGRMLPPADLSLFIKLDAPLPAWRPLN